LSAAHDNQILKSKQKNAPWITVQSKKSFRLRQCVFPVGASFSSRDVLLQMRAKARSYKALVSFSKLANCIMELLMRLDIMAAAGRSLSKVEIQAIPNSVPLSVFAGDESFMLKAHSYRN